MKLIEFLVQSSAHSRRELMDMLKTGVIKINKKPVYQSTLDIHPKKDKVSINEELVQPVSKLMAFKFNKPLGIISTMTDPKGRKCLGDFTSALKIPVFPVGRLDRKTSGLLIFTNDGQLANQLMHPKFHIPKTYSVETDTPLSKAEWEKLQSGIFLEDGPAQLQLEDMISPKHAIITIFEGRNHIIRRMMAYFKKDTVRLKRLQLGSIGLNNLKPGHFQPLTPTELKALNNLVQSK